MILSIPQKWTVIHPRKKTRRKKNNSTVKHVLSNFLSVMFQVHREWGKLGIFFQSGGGLLEVLWCPMDTRLPKHALTLQPWSIQ
jgi:hypothetical protein